MQDIVNITCPYCGEISELYIDFSGGTSQSYYEDCPVCCRPWLIRVEINGEVPSVNVQVSN